MINIFKEILIRKREEKIRRNLQRLRITFKSAIAYKNKDNHRLDKSIISLKKDFHRALHSVLSLEKSNFRIPGNILVYHDMISDIESLAFRFDNLISLKKNYLEKLEAKKNGSYESIYGRNKKTHSDSLFGFDGGDCDSGGDCGGD